MKILIYTHEFIPWAGGVATYNYELAKGLNQLGQDVIMLAPKYSSDDIILDQKMPFKVVRANLFKKGSIMQLNRNIRMLPVSAWRFIKALRQYRPDRVLITQAVAHESAALARLFYSFNFTLTVHGTEIYMHFVGGRKKQWTKSKLMQWFFGEANSIICVSNSTKKLLEQNTSNLRNKIFVVRHGIDPNEFSTNNASESILEKIGLFNQKVILTVARLSTGKGQDIIIRALPRILKEFPNTKYLIVGDGPKRLELEKLAEEIGVKDSVLFVGSIDRKHINNFYDACDIFVMLSRRGRKESFGIVYLEAWAYEKPVIGGDVGGVNEVIEHRKTGLLVNPIDVEAVAENICHLLRNQDLAKAMGRAGRKKVENEFSRKTMAQKTLDLL